MFALEFYFIGTYHSLIFLFAQNGILSGLSKFGTSSTSLPFYDMLGAGQLPFLYVRRMYVKVKHRLLKSYFSKSLGANYFDHINNDKKQDGDSQVVLNMQSCFQKRICM